MNTNNPIEGGVKNGKSYRIIKEVHALEGYMSHQILVCDDGTPIGIPNTDETILKITHTIRDTTKPDVTLFVKPEVEIINKMNIIVIHVQKRTACPYYIASKGIRPVGVYIRHAASTVPASEVAILKMISVVGKLEMQHIYTLIDETPFISERTPGENREDLWKLLEDCNMDYLNRLEWLIKTNTRYGGDRLYAERWTSDDDKHSVDYEDIEQSESRSAATIAKLLRNICFGHDINAARFLINDSNRTAYYSLLMSLYQKEKSYIDRQRTVGIRKSAAQGNYRGRKPAKIDDTLLIEVITKYRSGKLTAHEAATALGVSRSSFFRKLKSYEKKLQYS